MSFFSSFFSFNRRSNFLIAVVTGNAIGNDGMIYVCLLLEVNSVVTSLFLCGWPSL